MRVATDLEITRFQSLVGVPLVEVNDQLSLTELEKDGGAHPARLVVDLAEILLPGAEVKGDFKLRVLHHGLDHPWHLLRDVSDCFVQAANMRKVDFFCEA